MPVGLPPRLRDGRCAGRATAFPLRVTPAPAGRTDGTTSRTQQSAGYPRACGTDGPGVMVTVPHDGLPPRLRDGRLHLLGQHAGERVTPAPAGRTIRILCDGIPPAGYPRACGTDIDRIGVDIWTRGLPPRLRDGRVQAVRSRRLLRVTPAPAGRTRSARRARKATSGYPRACGTDARGALRPARRLGLPPRLRDGPVEIGGHDSAGRVTPAPAGRTGEAWERAMRIAGYPRACGTDWAEGEGRRVSGGLPPRLRDGQPVVAGRVAASRVTPAPAGRTTTRWSSASAGPGYPRACGTDPSRTAAL